MTMSANRMSHDAVNVRLPWYVNRTLPEEERAEVDAHIASCEACREALSLCEEMASAVRSDAAVPIPPFANAEMLLANSESRPGGHRSERWRIAAAVAVVVVSGLLAATWYVGQSETNQRFETVTERSALATVDYVFAVRFEPGVSNSDRQAVFAAIGGKARADDEVRGIYLLTLPLPPQTLRELDARAGALAARDEIASVEVVALQIPVR